MMLVCSCVHNYIFLLANQKVEEAKEELLQWSPTVRKHVDTLVMELTKRDALQLVYSAEDHAQALKIEAQAINRYESMCVHEKKQKRKIFDMYSIYINFNHLL